MLSKILIAEDCKQCKKCCKFRKKDEWDIPYITEKEKASLKLNFNIKHVNSGLWQVDIKGINNDIKTACPFLDDYEGCILKNKKPFDCSIWPLYVMKYHNKPVIALSKQCPVINKCDRERLLSIVHEIKDQIFKTALEFPALFKTFSEEYELLMEYSED